MDEKVKADTEKESKAAAGLDKMNKTELRLMLDEVIAKNEELEKKLAEQESLVGDYKDRWIRNAAEFDNYKKRNATIRSTSLEEGRAQVIISILPIGDNLERAISLISDENTRQGIEMLLRSFNDILAKEGVTEINPVGEPFNPEFHEALMQTEAEEGDISGNVKDVLIKGYMMGGKVIRYAKVRVIA